MKMMKFFLLAAAAVAAISCSKENLPVENEKPAPTPEVELVPMTFTASSDAAVDVESKVALDNGATVWQVGDLIKVIASNGTATDFKATEVTNGGKTATFEGLSVENANEYYAVYPASAYKGTPEYVTDPNGGKLVVQVPEVQQAVAGTFHPSAILCIANTKGNTFQFKHSCAFLKFNLANPKGVKSVRLKVNGSDNVAGIGCVGVDATDMNPKYDSNMSKYDMITLNAPEGGFVAGENYYIAMRANSCNTGITTYIEYEDKVMSRTGSKKVFEDGSIGKIKNLGQLDKNLSDVTPYDSYQMGFDITIGEKVINNEIFPTATLLTKESATKDLSQNGLYFINADAEGITLNSGKSIIAIGNTPNVRTNVTRSNYSYLPVTDGKDYWVLSNINLTTSSTNGNYMFSANGSGEIEELIIDNCSINVPASTSFINIGGSYKIKSVIIKDSEFLVGADNANNFIKMDATQTVDLIQFENNVFYSADSDAPAASFALINAKNVTVTDLLVNKNTLYGAMGTIDIPLTNCASENCTITNNMFVVQEISGGNVAMVGKKISATMNIDNNRCWINNTNGYRIGGVSSSFFAPSGASAQPGSLTPTAPEWDPSNGKFILHKSFGATR